MLRECFKNELMYVCVCVCVGVQQVREQIRYTWVGLTHLLSSPHPPSDPACLSLDRYTYLWPRSHTAAEFGCQSWIWVHMVMFTRFSYLQEWQLHSITELTNIHFQNLKLHSLKTCTVWTEPDWTTSCPSRHVREIRSALHMCSGLSCVVSVIYSNGDMGCV